MTLDQKDYFDILASAKMGLWMISIEDKRSRLYVDDVCADLMGIMEWMSPEEAYEHWFSCLEPADYPTIENYYKNLMAGFPAEVTYTYNHPIQGKMVVRCSGRMDKNHPKGTCFIGCHQDVSNYHRLILEHEKKVEIADLVVEALSKDYLNVYLINEKENILEVVKQNGAYAVDALDGQKVQQFDYDVSWRRYADNFVYEEDVEYVKEAGSIERVTEELKTKEEYTGTFRVIRDGGIHYCQFNFARISKEIIIASFRNIDSIIQTEQAHKYRQELSDMIVTALARDYVNVFVHNSARGVVDIRKMDEPAVDGLEAGQVVKADFNEMWNAFVTKYVHPDDKEMALRLGSFGNVTRELVLNNDFTFSYRSIRDGEHHFQAKYIRLSSVRIIAAFRNIDKVIESETKQRQVLEDALKEVEQANKAKSRFLSNMSHDIRTPLNAIFGMTQIAMRNIDDRDRVVDSLKKIEMASEHLYALINDVLDMSKLDSGALNLHLVPVDLVDLVDDCLSLLEPMANSVGVSLLTHPELKPDKTDYLLASPLHLRQVILNLGSNAIKYNRRGGYLDLRVSGKPIGDDKVECTFVFKDNGLGMSEEFLGKVFSPFAQENPGSRTTYKGTGLGLSIVKGLVNAMGGTISVESQKNAGSTFTVVIPFQISKVLPEVESKQTPEDYADKYGTKLDGVKILVVEDNEINLEIAKCLLAADGADVSAVTDGRQAVDLVRAGNRYDMILMDIMMPVMDGYEATRQIRATGYELPILAMTANAFAEDKLKSLEAGMNGHVIKPFRIEELHAAFRSALASRSKVEHK